MRVIHRLGAIAVSALLLGASCIAFAADRPVIRISSSAADNVTFDPHRATTTNDKGVVSQMFSGLVRFAPGSAKPTSLEPDLAERWVSTPDGLIWNFHLRKGVQFHNDFGELKAE